VEVQLSTRRNKADELLLMQAAAAAAAVGEASHELLSIVDVCGTQQVLNIVHGG
jgi:hypothetical protein